MAYRNKVFVSFDGDTDINYYRLMRAWKQNDNIAFNFYDAHDINTALDSSQEVTIKRRLRERMTATKVVVSLIGRNTKYLYKFIRWELQLAISLDLPIIGVNLNGVRGIDQDLCPPALRDHLVIYVSFHAAILQYALELWPARYEMLKQQHKTGPFYYTEPVYNRLGL